MATRLTVIRKCLSQRSIKNDKVASKRKKIEFMYIRANGTKTN